MTARNAVKNAKRPVVNKRTAQVGKMERLRFGGTGFLEGLQLLKGQTAHGYLVQAAAWYFKSSRDRRLWFMAFIFHTSTYPDTEADGRCGGCVRFDASPLWGAARVLGM